MNAHTTSTEKNAYARLSRVIRFAEQPDNAELIHLYLSFPSIDGTTITKQREHLHSQFKLLIETVADELLPAHWRCQCLDCIYIPLFALQRLANCQHSTQGVQGLFNELRVISHYFQPGLSA